VAAAYSLSVVAAPIEPEPVNDMIVGLRAALECAQSCAADRVPQRN